MICSRGYCTVGASTTLAPPAAAAAAAAAAGDPAAGGCKILRQLDQVVAGAAAGDQRAEGFGEIAPPAEDIMVQLRQEAGRAGDQPPLFIGRIACRIGQRFVLGLN